VRNQETIRTPVGVVCAPTTNERNNPRRPSVWKVTARIVAPSESPNAPEATKARNEAVTITKQTQVNARAQRPTRGIRVLRWVPTLP
jgi:hypothetical protein